MVALWCKIVHDEFLATCSWLLFAVKIAGDFAHDVLFHGLEFWVFRCDACLQPKSHYHRVTCDVKAGSHYAAQVKRPPPKHEGE